MLNRQRFIVLLWFVFVFVAVSVAPVVPGAIVRADQAEQTPVSSTDEASPAAQPGQRLGGTGAAGGLATIAGTIFHIFQATELHPTLASVAPGGGLTGGIGYDPHRGNPRQLQNSLRASVSTKGYWLALADTTYRVSNIYSLELYGRARHMTELPFYGIGQDSQLSNQTDFTLTERVVGGSAYVRAS